jgi:hypothetical protein
MKKILTSPWTALLTLALILSIRIADPVFVFDSPKIKGNLQVLAVDTQGKQYIGK